MMRGLNLNVFILCLICDMILVAIIGFAFITCDDGNNNNNNGDDTHTHSYSNAWSYDATQHWHECTANDGAKTEVANHTGDPCTVCGYSSSNTSVTFSSVTANGSASATTTTLTLTFSAAITWLSANDITLSGVANVQKGTLSGSGPTYTLGISGFTAGGSLSVAVSKSGYNISGSPKTATIYYSNGDDTRPATPEAMSTKTALQYFTDNGIKAGWNMGNSTDAVTFNGTVAVKAVETAAGNPLATQALFNGVKQSGFDIVRITCTWIGLIGSAPDYKIDEARLKRVAEIIGYAKTAGIKAVIINIHHDGNNTQGNNTTWGFVDMPGSVNNPTKKNEIQNQISKMWTQIAEYFKNYGDYLIFETLNEVHNGNWGNGAPNNEQDILFDWNQAALSAIRATGGNNATRYVAVPGLGSTEPDIVVAANNRNKLLPNDGSNGTSKLIVSVHYYAPAQYTVAGVTDQAFQLIHTWGNQSEINSLNHEMELLKTNFIDRGIAVYIGEWGAPTDVRSSMNQTIKDTHLNYIKLVATAARANGVLPIYWDDGGNFKVLERSNGRPKTGLWADVLSTMMTAINNATPPTPGTKTITINPNIYGTPEAQHGYQAKLSLSELLGGSITVTSGNTFTLTYTFTSNVAIDNLQVVLVDTRPAVSSWKELSAYENLGAVTVGTPVSGTKTITATATAGDSSNDANQFVFNIGENDNTASAPTLTFTALTLVKN